MPKKRAVILIHGMGNQSPMASLRGFVEAVWTSHDSLGGEQRREIWSKPDIIGDTRELRRVTTRADKDGIRTDFFEFYWAHLMHSTRLSSLVWWFAHLLLRSPRRVPENVRGRWVLGWISVLVLTAAIGALTWAGLALVNPTQFAGGLHFAWRLGVGICLASALWFLRHRVLIEVLGDAARYLTASPGNIRARTEIREAGLRILKAVHNDDYERVIVVGHSLGAVIGYDLLSLYWADICKELVHETDNERQALIEIQCSAAALHRLDPSVDRSDLSVVEAYRANQREYARALAGMDARKWLITDFVSLGSPLAHAHFLLVDDKEKPFPHELARAKRGWLGKWLGLGQSNRKVTARDRVARLFGVRASQREFPVNPPQTEFGRRFSYQIISGEDGMVPHHAAPFAPVRWTNIFAPFGGLLRGDPVGGPAAPVFGPGVRDVGLAGPMAKRPIAHTVYWQTPGRDGDSSHIDALRSAVNLADVP